MPCKSLYYPIQYFFIKIMPTNVKDFAQNLVYNVVEPVEKSLNKKLKKVPRASRYL